jgi:ribonuclease Z
MIVKCFGTAGYHPSEDRHTSCYYLPDAGVLLDAGTGIFRLTQELRAVPRESIDILLSHAHLDHVIGITFLLDTQAVTKLKQVRLIGEAPKLKAIREHLYSSLLFPVPPEFQWLELPAVPSRIPLAAPGAYLVDWVSLEHSGGSIAYVIEVQGHRLAYVTDTTACVDSPYLSSLNDLDLLLHECNFGDEDRELAEKTGHSWLSAVTDVVRSCRPKQSWLIHHNPLAKMLGCELTLGREHELLHMRIANDLDAIEF